MPSLPPVLERPTRALCDLSLLGGGAITAACLAGSVLPILDGLNHFQPFWTVAALAPLLLALATRHPTRLRLATALLVIQAALLAAPLLRLPASPAQAANATPLKVMSLNINWYNRHLDRVVELIRRENADIVLLQEFGRIHADKLNAVLTPLYPFRRYCNDFSGCDGALLSKRPWLEVRHVLRRENAPPLITALFDFGRGQRLRVVGVHTWNPQRPRRQQREMSWLETELSRSNELKIVAGDFNLTPWTFTLNRFQRTVGVTRTGGIAGTWPASSRWIPPLFPIDHVMTSPEIRVVSIRRGPYVGSDHLPIIAELSVP